MINKSRNENEMESRTVEAANLIKLLTCNGINISFKLSISDKLPRANQVEINAGLH